MGAVERMLKKKSIYSRGSLSRLFNYEEYTSDEKLYEAVFSQYIYFWLSLRLNIWGPDITRSNDAGASFSLTGKTHLR
jgi:hypothetical protein